MVGLVYSTRDMSALAERLGSEDEEEVGAFPEVWCLRVVGSAVGRYCEDGGRSRAPECWSSQEEKRGMEGRSRGAPESLHGHSFLVVPFSATVTASSLSSRKSAPIRLLHPTQSSAFLILEPTKQGAGASVRSYG